MPFKAPRIERTPEKTCVTVNVRPMPYAVVVGAIYILIWVAGLFYLPYLAFTNTPSLPAYIFIGLGWLTLVVGGLGVGYGLAWSLLGRESLVVEAGMLHMRYQFLNRVASREFPLNEVKRLRIDEECDPSRSSPGPMAEDTVGEGPIAFEHKDLTYRMGRALGHDEAEHVLLALQEAVRECRGSGK